MNWMYWSAALLAGFLFVYLLYALLFAEEVA